MSSAPFGIAIHAPLDTSLKRADMGGAKWDVLPPNPHPAFETYYVQDAPIHGVVWVKAITPQYANDPYGTSLQNAFDRIVGQVASRYGKCNSVNTLRNGAIWDQSRDFVASLFEGDRFYWNVWDREHHSNLPEDLESVFVGVLPHGHSDASVIIEYTSVELKSADEALNNDLSNLL